MKRIAIVLHLLVAILLAGPVQAHPASQSQVYLGIDRHQVGMTLWLPADQLATALPQAKHWQTLKRVEPAELQHYLATHIELISSDEVLSLQVENASLVIKDDENYFKVNAIFSSTGQQALDQIQLNYDVILHRVINHRSMIFLQTDFGRGLVNAEPQLIDIARYHHTTIQIDRNSPHLMSGLKEIFLHGVHHILGGSDHLAFLLSLLLVTGLRKRGARWLPARASVTDGVKLVSAFAIGHSITLLVNALNPLPISSVWIESLVAVSVLIGAINVIVPIIAKQQLMLALAFGLVHGMAFANSISVSGLQISSKIYALLAFNLGIEFIQIALLLVLLPCINLWRASAAFSFIRFISGLMFSLFAITWLLQRVTPQYFPVSDEIALSVSQLAWVLSVTIVLTGCKFAFNKWRSRRSLEYVLS